MAQVFMSFRAPDHNIVRHIQNYLAHLGYSSWNFIDNAKAGPDYVHVVAEELEKSQIVVFVISRTTFVDPREVVQEAKRTYDDRKPFIPVLVGLTHAEFKQNKDLYNYLAQGTTTSIVTDVEPSFKAIRGGLQHFRIIPEHEAHAEPFEFPSLAQLQEEAPSSFELRPQKKARKKAGTLLFAGAAIGILALALYFFLPSLLNQQNAKQPDQLIAKVDSSSKQNSDSAANKNPSRPDVTPPKTSEPVSTKPVKDPTPHCTSGYLIVADDPDDPTGVMRKTLKSDLHSQSSIEFLSSADIGTVCAKHNAKFVVIADAAIESKKALNKHTLNVKVRLVDSTTGRELLNKSFTQEKVTPAFEAFRANALKELCTEAAKAILSAS